MDQVRLLIATDLSENSLPALEKGGRLASMLGAKVMLVHCMAPQIGYPPPINVSVVPPETSEEEAPSAALSGAPGDKYAQSLKEVLADWGKQHLAGLEVSPVLLTHESPAFAVCSYAKEQDVDWIVVATHGRTGLAGMFVGSVAERIVRHAPCTVVVARAS